jgi:hypothetical protein
VSAAAVAVPAPPRPAPHGFLARPFVGHALDHLVIGGGLSLLVVAFVAARPEAARLTLTPLLPWFLVLVNGAHFAASTGRLYTRPGATERWPFLTVALPFVALLAMAAGAFAWESLGRNLQALYLTWSPFHYAAQTYGLTAMYCARSGAVLRPHEAQALRAACLLPFLFSLVSAPGYGIFWPLPASLWPAQALQTVAVLRALLTWATWVAPALVYAVAWWTRGAPLPLIVPVLMFANASWWLLLSRYDAFGWAAVFHGLQYLAIVLVFHVRERPGSPAWRSGLGFYAGCVAFGFAMFNCWPGAFSLAGLGLAQSVLMVTAVVNIHHFVVDAYIWRIRRDPNAAVVAG